MCNLDTPTRSLREYCMYNMYSRSSQDQYLIDSWKGLNKRSANPRRCKQLKFFQGILQLTIIYYNTYISMLDMSQKQEANIFRHLFRMCLLRHISTSRSICINIGIWKHCFEINCISFKKKCLCIIIVLHGCGIYSDHSKIYYWKGIHRL